MNVNQPLATAPATKPKSTLHAVILTQTEEIERFDRLLDAEHFLASRHPSGHTLRQVVVEDGQWVALVLWVSGFWHLQDRDRWIDWDAATRAERLKLIVHNARFLVPQSARRPSLASQALATALRLLPEQWQQRFGYEPLLAETFTDPDRHAGTVYKATGWIEVGHSQPKALQPAEHRCDFFPHFQGLKRLWLKPLHPQAQERLRAPHLLPEHAPALNPHTTTRCALSAPLRQSLCAAFRQVPDPRAREGRRYPLGAVLTIIALALLRGAVHLSTIHRTGTKLDQRQRAHLGLGFKKGTRFRPAPGYFVYRDLLRALDLDAFARVLTTWLQAHAGQLPRTLAIDGKTIRDHLGLVVTLVDTEEGTPVALAAHPEGKGHELKTAQALLASPEVNLHGATVTGDSLHCQDQTAAIIVLEKGGDYLLQVRDNQPTVYTYVQTQTAPLSPLLTKPNPAMVVTKSAN